MNFKLPNNNEQQLELLEDIQLSQKNILAKFTELNNRISELEKSQRDIFSILQQKDDNSDDSFLDKLKLNIFISIAATFLF